MINQESKCNHFTLYFEARLLTAERAKDSWMLLETPFRPCARLFKSSFHANAEILLILNHFVFTFPPRLKLHLWIKLSKNNETFVINVVELQNSKCFQQFSNKRNT